MYSLHAIVYKNTKKIAMIHLYTFLDALFEYVGKFMCILSLRYCDKRDLSAISGNKRSGDRGYTSVPPESVRHLVPHQRA